MRTRSFNPVTAFVTCMLMLFGLASGCVSDPVTTDQITQSATTTPNPVEEADIAQSDTSSDAVTQSVTISGRTATVDGISLAEAWVMVINDTTQQTSSETSSDANGVFTITFNGAVGDYSVLAFYQDDVSTLIGGQGFSISDEVQDYQFDLSLSEPIVDAGCEDTASGAAPPPSCYLTVQAYFYQLCSVTHKFYARLCYSCYPYWCTYQAVGSC